MRALLGESGDWSSGASEETNLHVGMCLEKSMVSFHSALFFSIHQIMFLSGVSFVYWSRKNYEKNNFLFANRKGSLSSSNEVGGVLLRTVDRDMGRSNDGALR